MENVISKGQRNISRDIALWRLQQSCLKLPFSLLCQRHRTYICIFWKKKYRWSYNSLTYNFKKLLNEFPVGFLRQLLKEFLKQFLNKISGKILGRLFERLRWGFFRVFFGWISEENLGGIRDCFLKKNPKKIRGFFKEMCDFAKKNPE